MELIGYGAFHGVSRYFVIKAPSPLAVISYIM